MTRAEHLQWAKDRAKEYIDIGDTAQAQASFMSDMNKHEELADHKALELGMMLLLSGNLSTPSQMWQWIEGFN